MISVGKENFYIIDSEPKVKIAPSGNRTPGNHLEGDYFTTKLMVLKQLLLLI